MHAITRPSRVAAWWYAIRPWSLLMTIGPVLVGTALAWAEHGTFTPITALAAALAAVLIHVGCNLQNDTGGFARGADRFGRPGPPRATTLGWLAPGAVQVGALASFALAAIIGLVLVAHRGWPILLIGVTAIAVALLYMAGPRPIAYGGTSEALVLVYFGVVPVNGTFFLQAQTISVTAWISGAVLGTLSAAVLALNNYRDVDADRSNGRRTLAVRFGARFCRAEYTLLLVSALLLIAPLAVASSWYLIALCVSPLVTQLIWRVQRTRSVTALSGLLRDTVLLNFTAAMALAVAAVLGRITT